MSLSLFHCVTVSLCHCVTVTISLVTVSLCHCVTVSLCHCVTVSLCHCVTVSLCHCVTASLCHCVTVAGGSQAVEAGGGGGEVSLHREHSGGDNRHGWGGEDQSATPAHPPLSHRHKDGLQTSILQPQQWGKGEITSPSLCTATEEFLFSVGTNPISEQFHTTAEDSGCVLCKHTVLFVFSRWLGTEYLPDKRLVQM